MIDHSLIRRYMAAVYRLAEDAGQVDAVREQLMRLQTALAVDERLLAVLKHPDIPDEDKHTVLLRLAGEAPSEIVRGLVSIALDKERTEILQGAGDVFTELADDARGVVRAYVEVAHDPEPEQSERLSAALAGLMGKPVVLELRTAPEVIGGARVRIGGTLIDGSVAGHVDRLMGRIAGGPTAVASAGSES